MFRKANLRFGVKSTSSDLPLQPPFTYVTTMKSGSRGNDALLQAIKHLKENLKQKMATMKCELISPGKRTSRQAAGETNEIEDCNL